MLSQHIGTEILLMYIHLLLLNVHIFIIEQFVISNIIVLRNIEITITPRTYSHYNYAIYISTFKHHEGCLFSVRIIGKNNWHSNSNNRQE